MMAEEKSSVCVAAALFIYLCIYLSHLIWFQIFTVTSLTCVRIGDGEKITYVKTWSTFSLVSSRAETLSSVSINLLFRLITKKCEYQERHLQMNSDSSSAVTGWTRQCHWAVNHTECWAEVWSQATFLYHRNINQHMKKKWNMTNHQHELN